MRSADIIGNIALVVIFALIVFVVVSLVRAVRIVPQSQAYVVERLGRFQAVMRGGFHLLVPFVDRVAARIDLREQVANFPPQPVITADQAMVSIDSVIYFQITDPRSATYEVANFLQAIEQLTATTLRNLIGSLDLEQTQTSRESDQQAAARRPRRGHGPVGHPRDPRRAQVDRAAAASPGRHGAADHGGAHQARHDSDGRGRA